MQKLIEKTWQLVDHGLQEPERLFRVLLHQQQHCRQVVQTLESFAQQITRKVAKMKTEWAGERVSGSTNDKTLQTVLWVFLTLLGTPNVNIYTTESTYRAVNGPGNTRYEDFDWQTRSGSAAVHLSENQACRGNTGCRETCGSDLKHGFNPADWR